MVHTFLLSEIYQTSFEIITPPLDKISALVINVKINQVLLKKYLKTVL